MQIGSPESRRNAAATLANLTTDHVANQSDVGRVRGCVENLVKVGFMYVYIGVCMCI